MKTSCKDWLGIDLASAITTRAVSHDIGMCIQYEGLLVSRQLQKTGGVPRHGTALV